jgi:hypothetical protein
MSRVTASTHASQPVLSIERTGNIYMLLVAAWLLAMIVPVSALSGQQTGGDLQQKLAALKQSTTENQTKLHQYQWLETTQLALNGDAKPATQSMCQYGPDGKVQKTPMGAPPPPPSGGRLKQKLIAKKKNEMKDYMGQVKTLLDLYLPPNPQSMQQAYQAGKVSMNLSPSAGTTTVVFSDYALPGDKMTISFYTGPQTIGSLNVQTYMDDPNDAVTLAVQFTSLPDGTNYVQQSLLKAAAKKLQVTTTNSNYQLIATR